MINLKALKELYIKHEELFNKESPKVLVNSKYYLKPNEVFKSPEVLAEKNHFVW